MSDALGDQGEENRGDHGMRMANRGAAEGSEVAAVHAKWQPRPRSPEEFQVEPPVIKGVPELTTVEDQLAAIAEAYQRAIDHMHQAERGEAAHVVGAKTYGLAIIYEGFQLTPEDISHDAGALSDLTEYLTEMVLRTRGTDMRSPDFDFEAERVADPDINLVVAIRNTWDLPDREFGQPNMYQRVDWSARDFGSN